MKPKKKKGYNVMREFRIDKISAVDRPAQEGATALIMKRADEELIEKQVRMLTSVDGHTHLLDDTCMDNHTSYEKAPDDDYGHAHPWIRGSDGTITIGEADGHTHEILEKRFTVKVDKRTFTAEERQDAADEGSAMPDGGFPIKNKSDLKNAIAAFGRAKDKAAVASHIASRAKALSATDMLPTEGTLADLLGKAATPNPKDSTMNETEKAALKAAEDKAAALDAQLATAKAFGALSDSEKTYHNALPEGERAGFLTKSAAERGTLIEKAAGSNPVVYTSADGAEFRKNDDPRLVQMAKTNDANARQAREATAALAEQTLSKRAETELKHLPGEPKVKVALLKAVDSIQDQATREGINSLLKANNEAMAKAFEKNGTTEAPAGGSTNDQLESLAKKFATDNKVDIVEARVAVLDTPEGKALYAESQAR